MLTPCSHCGDSHDEALQACPRSGLLRRMEGPCGKTIDRYQVERLLGTGGFGTVYRAKHAHTHQPIALKLLRPDLAKEPQMLERLFLEARAAAAVDDPRIVRVSDCGIATTGEAFIAMELLEGGDLRELSREAGTLTLRRVVEVMIDVLEALEAAHAKGVVHRDLKPANVFLAQAQGKEVVKLLDFGISKVRGHDSGGLTRSNVAMGTPTYMAPEQMRSARDVDGRADVYSVGAMTYELLTGEPPFVGEGYEDVVVKVLTTAFKPLRDLNPRLPMPLCTAIQRALARDPAERWPNAKAFADALKAALQDTPAEPVTLPIAGAFEPTVPSPKSEAGAKNEPVRKHTATPAYSPMPPQVTAPPVQQRSGLGAGLVIGALIAIAAGALGVLATRGPAQAQPVRVEAPQPMLPPAPLLPAPPPPPIIPMPPEQPPQLIAVQEPPKPPPVHKVSGASGPVTIHEPNLVGQLDYSAVRKLLDGARDSLDACRTSKTITVYVHLHTHEEGVALARDDPNQTSDDLEAARCVANRLKDAASHGWKSGGSGIVAVAVTLAGR
jgi:serine/threonine-protein kinase